MFLPYLSYQRYAWFFSDADPGFAEVEEAGRRLASLAGGLSAAAP